MSLAPDNACTYSAEFAEGWRGELTMSGITANIEWTPNPPRLKGEKLQRFLVAYRTWRDEALSDFARRSGISIAVVDL